jgi:hypothetical protein
MAEDLPKPQTLQPWFDLQSATLRRVHASWFAEISPELIATAHTRSLGRRWLANQLSRAHPMLFELPHDIGLEAMDGLRRAEWILPLVEDAEQCALDIGAVALAPTLRTIVAHSAVSRLRQVLGTERYERMLAAATKATGSASDNSVLTEADESIVESVVRCGAWELAEFAERLHPMWGESVRLSFEREWWQGDWPRALRQDEIQAILRQREQMLSAAAPGAAA